MTTLLRLVSVAVLVAAVWLLASSPFGPGAGSGYYPLDRGLTWEYQINPGAQAPLRLTVTNTGTAQIGSWRATAQKLELADTSAYRFAIETPDRVAIVGEQPPGQALPTVLDPPAVILRLPPSVGTTWSSDGTTTALRPGTKVRVTSTVESDDDTVSVLAGTFESCVRVGSAGKAEVVLEDGSKVEIELENKLWYAPGVGVIRIRRTESTDVADVKPVETEYQLVSRF